ncbi:hypothetical protein HMPREF9074_07812 [Capnocytophaga sp. oral taxon 329 str. F0087]|nr:hypothetical protein HMPREF9074_07812 [Capnocytophaga sp. oral taxon 329 str. F0087]
MVIRFLSKNNCLRSNILIASQVVFYFDIRKLFLFIKFFILPLHSIYKE